MKREKSELPLTKCFVPECNSQFDGTKHARSRGLCSSCYQKANSLVAQKKTTWEEMEKLGLAKRKCTSLVELALEKARKEKLTNGV